MIKVGHRVYVRSIKRKGSVEFIDWPRLSFSYMYPIQVALDRPYGEGDQMMYRTSADDLKRLKKSESQDDRWSNRPIEIGINLDDFDRYLRNLLKTF